MKFNKKSFWKSLYKISTVLFLVGYNFAPVALAAEEISNLEPDSNQSVSVTTEDTSEDILDEGISNPEGIAKGENVKGEEAQKSVSLQDTVSKKENDSQTKIELKASPMGNSDFINITSVTVDNQSHTTVVRPGTVRVRVDATKNIPWGSTYYKLSNNKYACVVKSDTEGTTHEFDLDIGMDVGLGEYDLSITAYERSDCSTGWFWNPSYKSDTKVLAKAVKVQDAPNPLLGQTCGLDISLVLDTSGSIGSTKLQQMKEAFYLLIDSLKGTPTRFSLVEFNTKAYVRQDFTDDFDLVKTKIAQFQSSGRTNWYDALLKSESTFDPRLDKADLIVFASDGNPNEPSNALNKAIEQANLIKGDDIRILGIAIGMNVNLNNMKAITGPNLNTGDFRTSDVISADFDTLADQLGKFASDTCGGSISINKYIGSLGTKGGAGWEFTVTPSDPLLKLVTDENGQVNSGELSVGTYSVIETSLSGHNFVSASCKKGSGILVGQPTKNGVKNIPVNADDIITCDFINDLSCKAGQHTLEGQIKGNGYTTGQLCAGSGACWAEGDNVPARLTITGLEVGTSYSAIVSHDFENAYGKVGYVNFNNVHSGNNTATNITLSEPTIEGTGPTTKKYTITFTPTNSTVQLDWNALLSDEAGEWSGGSLHYRLEDGVCGGLGKREIPINPNQIQIKGSIKPIKSSENNINPTQWSFNISGLVNVNNVASGEKATGLPLGDKNADATYTITETGLSGYELVSVSEPCVLDDDGKVTVTLTKANPDVECTFVNKLMVGNIIVKKVTEPSGSTEVFTFTTTGTGYNGFTLTDATSNTQTLVPGTYTVSESLTELQKDSWYLKSSTCDSSIVGKSQSPSNLNLASGETVTCTFTNTQYGSISGHKWNDADGSDLTTDDRTGVKNWRIFIDENGDEKYDEGEKVLLTDENGFYKFEDLKPGTYVIVEDMNSLDGWYGLKEGISHTVYVGPGKDVEDVDFVNVKYGSITVLKNVDGNGDGDLDDEVDVKGSDQWNWTINSADAGKTGSTQSNLKTGEYIINEKDGPVGYSLVSVECTGSEGMKTDADGTTTVNLKSGENVTCTYTNARDTGTLIVEKIVVDADGGILQAKDFSFKVDMINEDESTTEYISPTYFTPNTENPLSGKNTITLVPTGTYSITEVEANQRGYTTTYSDNCTNNVNIQKGDTVTCTITNTPSAPTLKIVKDVINDNGGNATISTFGITLTDTPLTFGDGTPVNETTTRYEATPTVVANKTYTLSELDKTKTGYEQKKLECLDTDTNTRVDNKGVFRLNLGQNIECKIVNDDIVPVLILDKEVNNKDLPWYLRKSASAWTLTATGPTTLSGKGRSNYANDVPSGKKFKAGTYTLSETNIPGFKSVNGWVCNGVALGEDNKITLGVGDRVTCKIVNESVYGKIIVKKLVEPKTDPTLFTFTGDVAGIIGHNGEISKYVIPGEYSVTEKSKDGWNLRDLTCTDPTNNSSQDSTNKYKANINVGDNETVRCTFTNEKLGIISGFKYEDKNGNGKWDVLPLFSELPLRGWRIFIDLNNDGVLNVGEPSTTTDVFGSYTFTNLPVGGTYVVREVQQDGWTQTTADPAPITIAAGDVRLLVNFGNFKDATINVTKDVVGIDGKANVADTHEFTALLNDETVGKIIAEGTTATYKVANGAHTITEAEDEDYTSLGCFIGDEEFTNYSVKSGQTYNVVCKNAQLPATLIVRKNVVNSEGKDEGVFSDDQFDIVLGEETQQIADTANGKQPAIFEGLQPGVHTFTETPKEGYIFEGCTDDGEVTLGSNQTLEVVCTNKVIDPILKIEKSNDAVSSLLAGDMVTYTITVTAPIDDIEEGTYVLNNVVVSDIAPAGFKYILGSWTVEKNSVDITDEVPEPTYNDTNVAQWMIGDMKEGDVVVLTYRTRISLLQDPGNYPDIAWVAGTSLIDGAVLGASTVDPLTPFVGTDVTVIEPDIVEEGEVLGASITLPDTGASTYLTLGALIMMILGVIALLFKPFKKLNYALLTGLMAVSFVTLLTPNRVLAEDSDIKVRIMQPATPTNKSSFNVGFVALDLKNNPITVECYKDAVLFETLPNVNTGNCPAKVDASGTYTFYVIAKSTSGEQKSADVTVVVDLEKPSPVIDYSKAGNVLKFKTANDGKTKKVEIHRSTTPKYTANESTRIHTMDVLPNTEYSWTDTTAETGKTYYYALRTVDAVGNVSTIVSDPEVKIVPPTTTGTGTTATVTTPTEGEVAGQTDTKKEGEVAGEADDLVEGEEKDVEKKEETKEDTKADLKETGKKILNKWYIWVVAILVLGGVAFYVKKQKSN
ncbi:MAG TPA: VWA domain-containing protein [Candidatus Dojkabacteria bacterium]|nr:VWA domain-containing protein [Candidatus Dojkabacteria bacterium]